MTAAAPTGAIRYYQDGDVYRIVDAAGRRYYFEGGGGHWEAEPAPGYPAGYQGIWDKRTAFTEREAQILVDALHREQKAIAVADELAAGFHALNIACGAARVWRTRRNDQ